MYLRVFVKKRLFCRLSNIPTVKLALYLQPAHAKTICARLDIGLFGRCLPQFFISFLNLKYLHIIQLLIPIH